MSVSLKDLTIIIWLWLSNPTLVCPLSIKAHLHVSLSVSEEQDNTRVYVLLCGHLPRARGSGQDFRGARMRGKTDGSVIATLKQGHSVSAADTAILRGCIILVQSLHFQPVRGESGHAVVSSLDPLRERTIGFVRDAPCLEIPLRYSNTPTTAVCGTDGEMWKKWRYAERQLVSRCSFLEVMTSNRCQLIGYTNAKKQLCLRCLTQKVKSTGLVQFKQ